MTTSPARIDDFRQKISWCEIEQSTSLYHSLLQSCVKEDLGNTSDLPVWRNDLTTSVCGLRGNGSAQLVAREPFVLCGVKVADLLLPVFSCNEVEFQPLLPDGHSCQAGDLIGTLRGAVPQILAIERTLLNFIQRLCGVATEAASFVSVLKQEGVELLDTRKTTPGLRIFEKFATTCGGSYNHRMGLFDRVVIKDNHLAAAKVKDKNSLRSFLIDVTHRSSGKLVELELDDLSHLEAAIEGKVDAVLLDNFSPTEITRAVEINQNRIVLEASGGINKSNLLAYAKAQPHFISTGAPVHSAQWVDIGLDWID